MPVYNTNIIKRGPDRGKLKPPEKRRLKPWQCHYQDPATGKWKDAFFAKKTEAENFDAEKLVQNNTGVFVDDKMGNTLVSVYVEAWLNILGLRPASMRSYRSIVKRHIIPHFGHLPLKAVRRTHVKAWMRAMEESAAPSSVYARYVVLSAMFKAAVYDKAIPSTPCLKIKLPDVRDDEPMWLPSARQVAALIERMPDRLKLAVILAAGCGLRWGEIFGLTIDEDRQRSTVDFMGRKVQVRHQLARETGEGFYLGPPKTRKSRREVDLPAFVAAAISEHIRAGYTSERTMVDASVKPAKRRTVTMLFSRENNRLWWHDEWADVWSAAVKATPELADAPEKFSVHDLRHYFASLKIAAGCNVKQVQVAMGHAKPSTTLNVYTHLFPSDDGGKATSVIDDAFTQGQAGQEQTG